MLSPLPGMLVPRALPRLASAPARGRASHAPSSEGPPSPASSTAAVPRPLPRRKPSPLVRPTRSESLHLFTVSFLQAQSVTWTNISG